MKAFILAAVWVGVGLGSLWLSSRNDFPMKNRIDLLRASYLILLCTYITTLVMEGFKIYDYQLF